MDQFDLRILTALQEDGALTNAALSDRVHLSPSQCSRRRAALEAEGIIDGYTARLNAAQLGFSLRAVVRLSLKSHDRDADAAFSRWLSAQPEIQLAFSTSGDADYILLVSVRSLEAFSDFVHERLLRQPQIAQVRSDFVLKTLKDSAALDLLALEHG
ncbi:MAG: Lrp/AsnC family transcriptional regulator [Pelagimonas sp.]|jgi:DNA-binding Lrp family transcriptional regulator|nr:Lrp/AsnC family transcriptional regulator [Pelagimonas sp.]